MDTHENLNDFHLIPTFNFTITDEDCLIPAETVSDCVRCGKELSRAAAKRANELVKNGVTLESCSPALLHFFSPKIPRELKKSIEVSNELVTATKLMQMKLCTSSKVTPNTFLSYLENELIRPKDYFCKPYTKICHSCDKYRNEGGIQCCLGNGVDVLPQDLRNDKCIPICVPDNDPFYCHFDIKCLNFVRSVTTTRDDCSMGYAEQAITSYLDGSPLYGSDSKLAVKLRKKSGGRLKEESRTNCKKGFLPTVDDKTAVINQTPTLAVLHTILLREHNRIADILSSLNPLWSDEKLFQEARRIVIAEIQHITYQEWLPFNFGENYIRYYRISPTSFYSRDYSEDVNPGVINGFGAGAFRYLHTMVPDSLMSCPANYQAAYLYKLSDHYFNPSLVETSDESFDDLVRGFVTQQAGESDPHCTGEITNLLFKSHNKWGLDLIAMDIQRGRDHGIASYNDYRYLF
ncbi:unnamed protein product [Leptidea sinapis]|uniref:Uncharacterized protein n=1 Tax=Leptidea sinapis TaxID=189913 RepID=A0A5E4QAM2_9NEOP|nr:unnamed protein product [Leptidea sinapis]